jgi:hypothetical protein
MLPMHAEPSIKSACVIGLERMRMNEHQTIMSWGGACRSAATSPDCWRQRVIAVRGMVGPWSRHYDIFRRN